MKIHYILFCKFLLFSATNKLYSQSTGVIIDSLSELSYSAYFRDVENNITNEVIIFKSLGLPWEYQKTQIKAEQIYHPTDSVINNLYNPLSKKGKEKNIRISSKSSTGFIDNNNTFWIHPFRSNQYIYTEIAPFPSIYYDKLTIGAKWEEKTIVSFGWGNFKGKINKYYEVISAESYDFQGILLENCWLIKAKADHNKLGESTLTYLFHEEYGFLYLKYRIYNGIEIEFNLIDKK